MARRIRVKYLGDICSRRELKQAMAEIEMRTWYAEKRLADSAGSIFSLDNLLSMVPGAGNGFAIVKGLFGAFRRFRSDGFGSRSC